QSFFAARSIAAMGRLGQSRRLRGGVIAAVHFAAFAVMLWTEYGWFAQTIFVLAWSLLNFSFLTLLRRPGLSAVLSLLLVATLVVLSQFKFTVLWMVINFFDILIVDSDTIAFLLSIFPDLRTTLLIAALLVTPGLWLIWKIDPFHVPRHVSLA